MNPTREALQPLGPPARTGIRLVLTNAADPGRADDYRPGTTTTSGGLLALPV